MYGNQVSRTRAQEQKKNVVHANFKILHYLNIVWDEHEHHFLERNFRKTDVLAFKDLKIFKQVQHKLAVANVNNGFFESRGFRQYLVELEAEVLRKCFLKQKRYSPLMYLEYLLAKYKWGAQLTTRQELKLAVKSLVFWKTQRVKSSMKNNAPLPKK